MAPGSGQWRHWCPGHRHPCHSFGNVGQGAQGEAMELASGGQSEWSGHMVLGMCRVRGRVAWSQGSVTAGPSWKRHIAVSPLSRV